MVDKKEIIREIPCQRRTVFYEIADGISVYQDHILINGILDREKIGITENENLETEGFHEIPSNNRYFLLKESDLKDLLKQKSIRTLSQMRNLCQIRKNPADFSEILDSCVLVQYDISCGAISKRNGNAWIPCSSFISFDDAYEIDDENYNLDALYQYLIQNPDRFSEVKKEKMPFISRSKAKKRIVFVWMPSEKEYADYLAERKKQGWNPDYLAEKKFAKVEQFRKKPYWFESE